MSALKKRRIPYVFSPHGKLSAGMFDNKKSLKYLWWLAVDRALVVNASKIVLSHSNEAIYFPQLKIENAFEVVGVPLIMSDNCNFRMLSEGGAAIEIDNFVVERWANAIDSVCLDQEKHRQMAESCKKMAPEFSWEKIIARWVAVYKSFFTASKANTKILPLNNTQTE